MQLVHAFMCELRLPEGTRCTCGIRSNAVIRGAPFLVGSTPEDVTLPAGSTSPFCVKQLRVKEWEHYNPSR